ncbi:MAG: hypothetical protein H3C39_11535 [Flavobacteriia bacterium]|nr:hypothetical protein [Flavobacteriia bacterium]
MEICYAQKQKTDTLAVAVIEQDHGLSQLNALSIDFDDNGYLWIGTENGLNRYNGYGMKVFHAGENNNLRDDHIRSMYYEKDTLWLATNTHSVCAYLLKENRFIDFENKLNFKKNPLIKYSSTLTPVGEHYLLSGTMANCLLIDKRTLKFTIIPIPDAIENDFVTAILQVSENEFLIGTNFSGIFRLNLKQREIDRDETFSRFKNVPVNSLYSFSAAEILIGTQKGMFLYNKKKNFIKQINYPNKNENILSIRKWDNSNLFIGSSNNSYLMDTHFNLKKIIFRNHEGKEIQASITSLKKDELGGIWLATAGRGVLYFHPHQKKFTPYRISAENSPKKNFISSFNFLRDKNTLWIATEFGFVSRHLDSEKYKLYFTNLLEYTITKDFRGNIWAGGFGQSLVKYNPKTDKFDKIPLSISDQDVIQITPVSKDSIWIHTWSSGIYALNVNDYKIRPKTFNGKTIVRARASFRDSSENIWIGCDEGLYKISGKKVEHFNKLSNPRVFVITEDPEKNIWIGTAKGLNKLDAKTQEITFYTKQTGLPNDFIYGAEADGKGHIWVSTNFGISEFNPKTNFFKNYTENDGLQNNEFNGKAAYKDSLGNLYFGGMNGYNIFHPKDVFVNRKVGKTLIENIKLLGKSIQNNVLYSNFLEFSHDQNVITFEYVSLNYLWPEKNRYQFILEGFDKEWRPVTKERSTTYTNLDPGTYVFKVKGSNNELIWGNPASITIIIKSPWYKTIWFRTLLASFLAFLIIGVFLYKNYQQKQTNRRLSKMVEVRTHELTESNNALNHSLEVSEKQKENIAFLMRELNHRVKNNLQIITSLIDIQDVGIEDEEAKEKLKILQARIFTVSRVHDILNTSGEQSFVRIDEFISNLARELIEFSGEKIELQTNLRPVTFGVEKLTYLGLIINELITNSIKYAFDGNPPAKKINIELTEEEHSLKLLYRDNGKGYASGIIDNPDKMGLNLIRFLAKELKGLPKFKNESGAVFILNFDKNL